jgi:hypothetical protein
MTARRVVQTFMGSKVELSTKTLPLIHKPLKPGRPGDTRALGEFKDWQILS